MNYLIKTIALVGWCLDVFSSVYETLWINESTNFTEEGFKSEVPKQGLLN